MRSALNANVTLYVPPSNTTDTTDSDSDSDESFYPGGPQFLTHVETFNAPLNMDVSHEEGSGDTNFRVRVMNNLGTTRVSLDNRFAGTFDVNTMFARADVLTWDGTSFDEQYDLDDDGDVSDDEDDEGYDSSSSSSGVNDLALNTDASSSSTASPSTSTAGMKKNNKVRFFLPAAPSTATTDATQPSGRFLEYDLISSSEIRGWVGIPPRPPPHPPRGLFGNQSHVDIISSLNSAQLILRP